MMKKFLSAMAVGAVLSSSRFMVLSNTTLMKPEALVAGGPAQGTATMPFHKASMGLQAMSPSSTSGPLTLRLDVYKRQLPLPPNISAWGTS